MLRARRYIAYVRAHCRKLRNNWRRRSSQRQQEFKLKKEAWVDGKNYIQSTTNWVCWSCCFRLCCDILCVKQHSVKSSNFALGWRRLPEMSMTDIHAQKKERLETQTEWNSRALSTHQTSFHFTHCSNWNETALLDDDSWKHSCKYEKYNELKLRFPCVAERFQQLIISSMRNLQFIFSQQLFHLSICKNQFHLTSVVFYMTFFINHQRSLIDSSENANLDIYLCERETRNLCNSSFSQPLPLCADYRTLRPVRCVVSVSRENGINETQNKRKTKIDFLMKLSMSTDFSVDHHHYERRGKQH